MGDGFHRPRAYGKAPTFNTNNSGTFKRAVDMTDDELAAIVAKAKLTVVKWIICYLGATYAKLNQLILLACPVTSVHRTIGQGSFHQGKWRNRPPGGDRPPQETGAPPGYGGPARDQAGRE